MLEAQPNSGSSPVTQAKIVFGQYQVPWSEAELAKLRTFAPNAAPQQKLLLAFPGRTLKAVKRKLTVVREEMGLSRPSGHNPSSQHRVTMLAPDEDGIGTGEQERWNRRAIASNQAFLAALSRIQVGS
jgi:hypothetical protein